MTARRVSVKASPLQIAVAFGLLCPSVLEADLEPRPKAARTPRPPNGPALAPAA